VERQFLAYLLAVHRAVPSEQIPLAFPLPWQSAPSRKSGSPGRALANI